jgi:hypothetical protein
VEYAREAFGTVVALGGRDAQFWIRARSIPEALRDNAARVGDSELRARLEAIARTWDDGFTLAPPANEPPNLERQGRLAATADLARGGLRQCTAALVRLNALDAGAQ